MQKKQSGQLKVTESFYNAIKTERSVITPGTLPKNISNGSELDGVEGELNCFSDITPPQSQMKEVTEFKRNRSIMSSLSVKKEISLKHLRCVK